MSTQTEVIGHIITSGMRVAERPAGQSVRRRGKVSLQMTAQDIISVAVNCRQNGRAYPDWLLNILGCDSTKAVDAMLDELFGMILEVNRRALEKRQRRS